MHAVISNCRVFMSSSWLDIFLIWLYGYFMVQLAITANNALAKRNIHKLMVEKEEVTKKDKEE